MALEAGVDLAAVDQELTPGMAILHQELQQKMAEQAAMEVHMEFTPRQVEDQRAFILVGRRGDLVQLPEHPRYHLDVGAEAVEAAPEVKVVKESVDQEEMEVLGLCIYHCLNLQIANLLNAHHRNARML